LEASNTVRIQSRTSVVLSGSTGKWLCLFPRNDVVVLLDIVLIILYQE